MAFQSYASFKGAKQQQLKAESAKKGRSDKWCEILSIDMSSETPHDPKSGRPKGSRTHFPLLIRKEIGVASPQLLQAHLTNEQFTEVVIEIVGRPNTGAGEVVVERITLTNALIVKAHRYTPQMTTDHNEHDTDQLEDYSFVFSAITVENLIGSTSVTDDITANNT